MALSLLTRRAAPLLLFACLWLASCTTAKPGPQFQDVTIDGHTFHLELALDNPTRFRGLSDRKEIAADGGMLFVFAYPEKLTFVMRKCYVPIDIIFVNPAGRVVATHAMTIEPYDTPEEQLKPYPSHDPAQFVIELRGGVVALDHVAIGQKLDLPIDELKALAN